MQFIKIDKEFQNLLRPLTTEELKSLEESIKQDGCLRPIELWNGYIVDGHNRYTICMKNGIHFEQVDVTAKFETKSDVMKWIVQNQRARQTGRQLSKTELVAMADAVKEQTDKEARGSYQANVGRPKNGEEKFTQNFGEIDRHKRESVAKAAESIGVSAQTYRDMKLVTERGSDEQIERMNRGGRGNAPSAIAKEIRVPKNTIKPREIKPLEPAEDFLNRSRTEAIASETMSAIGIIAVQTQKITETRLNSFSKIYKKKELEEAIRKIHFMIDNCRNAIDLCETFLNGCDK